MPIRVLPQEMVNKIAAGEVVERPASVVKELVENSFDAGARSIEIELRGGGLELIRVSDDGQGMTPEDLRLCLLPHATSKITTYDDLLNIRSYGFRGEALSSMAAVSEMEVITRQQENPSGFIIQSLFGELSPLREQGAAAGTTVVVRRLFANVPARRKFLRSPETEVRRAHEEVIAQALAHPDIAFKMIIDGRVSLALPVQKESERWQEIWGDELFSSVEILISISGKNEIKGLISKPEALWPRRREQYLYVNGRRIQSRLLSSAVYQAYGPALQSRHPAYLLFLSLPPTSVDFNVHPAKREVRFRHEDDIFRFVKSTLEKTLFKGSREFREAHHPEFTPSSISVEREWSELSVAEKQAVFEFSQNRPEQQRTEERLPPQPPLVPCWQIHNRYIMAPIKNGLIIIDQHAAHERILYEEVLGRLGRATTQQLMFPLTVELSTNEMAVYQQYREAFEKLGFEIKPFGGRTLILEGLPASVVGAEGGDIILHNILEDLSASREPSLDHEERLARCYACHGAIKAGQPLSQEEMNRLIDRLFATSSPYLDPHGRPAIIKITLDDLERRFGRI